MSLQHPVHFESLRDVLKFSGISPNALVGVLREYLDDPKHGYTDDEMDLDHQVWAFRECILEFSSIIDEPKNQTTGSDGSDAEDARESQPRKTARTSRSRKRVEQAEIDQVFEQLLNPNNF